MKHSEYLKQLITATLTGFGYSDATNVSDIADKHKPLFQLIARIEADEKSEQDMFTTRTMDPNCNPAVDYFIIDAPKDEQYEEENVAKEQVMRWLTSCLATLTGFNFTKAKPVSKQTDEPKQDWAPEVKKRLLSIVRVPGICGGKATIEGTRIRLFEDVLPTLLLNNGEQELLEDYDHIANDIKTLACIVSGVQANTAQPQPAPAIDNELCKECGKKK